MKVRNVAILLFSLLPVMLGAVENSGAYQGPIQVVIAPIPFSPSLLNQLLPYIIHCKVSIFLRCSN